jgi:hypothetical protein
MQNSDLVLPPKLDKIPEFALAVSIRGGSLCEPCHPRPIPKKTKPSYVCTWRKEDGGLIERCYCMQHTSTGCCLLCASSQPERVRPSHLSLMKGTVECKRSACKCDECSIRLRLSLLQPDSSADKATVELGRTIRDEFQRCDIIRQYEEAYVKDASRQERRELCKRQIHACANNTRASSSWDYKWHIGSTLAKGEVACCKYAFAKFYGFSPACVDNMIREIKAGERAEKVRVITKDSSREQRQQYKGLFQKMRRDAESLNFEFTKDMQASACLIDTQQAKECYAWLAAYIALVGDPQPNRSGEIHLDECANYRAIHNEYLAVKQEEEGFTCKALGYNSFVQLWRDCFPHVKIRRFKAVDSKCLTCSNLTFLRTQAKTNKERAELTRLHTWHRVTFMGERKAYYARRQCAAESPQSFLSTIGDGMQQGHNRIPHMGASASQLVETLDTVIQGLLVHHKRIAFYRHFANVGKGANVAIYAWLSELEKEANASPSKTLPDTLYHQIDGGAENIAKTTIAIAEWLVLKGLTKRVVLTRLPVGHTHEDIDSVFAVLWKALRHRMVYSPNEQEAIARSAFKKQRVDWHDIYVVPDFIGFFSPFISHMDRYARRVEDIDWTQLQFIIEAIPNGVRTRYRAYAQNEVIELWNREAFLPADGQSVAPQISDASTLYVPVNVHVHTYPLEEEEQLTLLKKNPDGTWNIPAGNLLPSSFKKDDVNAEGKKKGPFTQIKNVLHYVRHSWRKLFPEGIIEWEEFYKDKYPREQDANEFVRLHPNRYHVPFKELFASKVVRSHITPINTEQVTDRHHLIQVDTNASVRHGSSRNTDIQPRTIREHERHGLASAAPVRVRSSMAESETLREATAIERRRNSSRKTKVPQSLGELTTDHLKTVLRQHGIEVRSKITKRELVQLAEGIPGMNDVANQKALIARMFPGLINQQGQTAETSSEPNANANANVNANAHQGQIRHDPMGELIQAFHQFLNTRTAPSE